MPQERGVVFDGMSNSELDAFTSVWDWIDANVWPSVLTRAS